MDNYQKTANDIITSMGIKFSATFLRSAPMFDDDKDERDIYSVKLERDGRKPFGTEFGQSLAKSRKWRAAHCRCRVRFGGSAIHEFNCVARGGAEPPTAYDLLASITKSDPGTFEDFCGDYGYDTDSRKALDTYLRVQAEWQKVRAFFSDDELERLQEIA